jgi:chromosome segregation ATPase
MSSASNSGGGSSNASNMGPPPNQQPRQPPQGGNNGHRKSSSLNRGWFEGTMEVISGMAPRPVTPSQNQNNRSASAPNSPAHANSPARGIGALFGGRSSPHHSNHFPPHIDRTNSGGSERGGGFNLPNFPINRLPSQDSLDRSIHNESGHGKSTAQIIRDLKHSNSALSAKMASQEKRHMNELSKVETVSFSKRQELEQFSAKQKMKLLQYEQYKAAAESKMKQQDAELSKVKEESAFQRHSISDLKNQLYQLQQELDERDEEDENRLDDNNGDNDGDEDLRRPHSDDGHNLPRHPGRSRSNSGGGLDIAPTSSSMSTEDLQQVALDNEELVKEIQQLQEQLMEYQGYDKKLKDLQRQLESAQKSSNGGDLGIPPRPTTPTHKNQPERERPPLVPSKSRDQDDDVSVSSSDRYRTQLQDAKEELEAQTQKLYQHESSVRDLEAEKETLAEAHSRRVQELEDRFVVLEQEAKERELTMREEFASLSQEETDQIETRLREEQQGQVVELEEQLEQYAEKLAEVAATLAESRQQAKNQEQYRKDEAEDLRMIQDAHEAEIVRLEKELDEATKELELRDEELEEVKQKYSLLLQQEKEDEKKVEESDTKVPATITDTDESKSAEESTNVVSEPKDDSNAKLVSELEEQLHISVETVKKLELQVESLRNEHNEAVAKLEMDKSKLSNDLKAARGSEGEQTDKKIDSPGLHRYWEEKTSKTKEVDTLKNEIENLRQRAHESTEAGRLAEQKVQDLKMQLEKSRSEEIDSSDSKKLSGELKLSKSRVVESEDDVILLKRKIDELSVENERVMKELEEAQSALVALDDDKRAMHDELNELVSSLDREKNIQNEMTAQLESQEVELAELQNMKSLLKPLEAEKILLQDEVERLKNYNASADAQNVTSPSASYDFKELKHNLEREIEDLIVDQNLKKTKLKDRDTTIATLLRSSIVLENKIESLQTEADESRAKCQKTLDELQVLKDTQVNRNEDYTKAVMENKYVKGQLKVLKRDAKRWKRALQEDGTTNGEYRYQVSMLQKRNEDFADTIQERDQAIQNLVNQSMGQDSHVRDLKIRISSLMKEVESVRMNKGRNDEGVLRAEIDRLQEESEIFAGQIIEQDEEFKRMHRILTLREEQIEVMKTEIESFNERNNFPDNTIIQNRDRRIFELQKKIGSLERQRSPTANVGNPIEMKNLRAELDEMQEAAESNRVEIRDLRQKLWEATDAAGAASDLRVQLDQARWEFTEYKRNDAPEKLSSDGGELRINLDKALARIKELEAILTEHTVAETKFNDLETGTSELKNKNKELANQLESKLVELENLTEKLDASQSEMDGLRELLQSKADTMAELLEQIKVSQNEFSKIKELDTTASTDETKSSRGDSAAILEYIKVTTDNIKSLHEQYSALQEDAVSLRNSLDGKTKKIEQFEDEASILTRDIDIAEQNLKAKTKTIDDLEQDLKANKIQLKEAGGLKAKLGNELADSQARLGALEKELSDAITETSSNEELSRKNQSLAQENASLTQKNESLVVENASLGNMNDNLEEESETLTKDNQTLCEELRALGQQKASRELELESVTAKKQSLKEQNKSICRERDELGKKVTSLTENIQAFNSISLNDDALQQKVENLAQVNDSLTNENRNLLEKNTGLIDTIENLKARNQILADNGGKLEESIESLKVDMEKLSLGTSNLQELRKRLHESEMQRESSDNIITEKYEKQLRLLSSSKDSEMDALRNNLTESRERSSENIGEVIAQLKVMEEENIGLRDQFEFEMQAKDQAIFALEHTLHAQEQIVETMRSEMDQIQGGMEHATQARRNEVDEMQQEMMQVEGKAMKQEREIVSLKMQLEERKLEHKADVVKLKDALAKAMEQDSPFQQTISDLQNNDRMLEVRERLEQLKARNTNLQEDNLNLGGRLERAAIQISAFEVEKQQAEEIEDENMKLRKQLKEYEQLLSRPSKSSRKVSLPQTSNMSSSEQAKGKKKKKFGIFKKRSVDESISEGKEEEEC